MILASYLKTKDCKGGEIVTFLNEGAWVEQEYKGNKSKSLQFLVNLGNKELICKVSKISKENLTAVWGNDTKNWKGKQATISIMPALIKGEMMDIIILKPVSTKPQSIDSAPVEGKQIIDDEGGWPE